MSGFYSLFVCLFDLLPYKVSLLAINGAPASGRLSLHPFLPLSLETHYRASQNQI